MGQGYCNCPELCPGNAAFQSVGKHSTAACQYKNSYFWVSANIYLNYIVTKINYLVISGSVFGTVDQHLDGMQVLLTFKFVKVMLSFKITNNMLSLLPRFG